MAVECRTDDERTAAILAGVDHAPTRAAVEAERAFLAELGSGCSLPVGAYADDGRITGFLADPQAGRALRRAVPLGDDAPGARPPPGGRTGCRAAARWTTTRSPAGTWWSPGRTTRRRPGRAARTRGRDAVVMPLTEIVDEPAESIELARVRPRTRSTGWWSPRPTRRAGSWLRTGPCSPTVAATRRPAIAGVGTQTAAILGGCDLVPVDQRAEGLLAELPAPAGRRDVLVVQAVDAASTLVDGLEERGWHVTAIRPYRSVARHPAAGEQLAALSADAVLFAAGSAARAWVEVFGTTTPPVVVAMGPQTAAAATAAGLSVTAVSGRALPRRAGGCRREGLRGPQ